MAAQQALTLGAVKRAGRLHSSRTTGGHSRARSDRFVHRRTRYLHCWSLHRQHLVLHKRPQRKPIYICCQRNRPRTSAEIDVTGNGQVILDGDTSPSTLDHTDFGLGGQFQAAISRTFTVRNVGSATLTLGPVSRASRICTGRAACREPRPRRLRYFLIQLITSALGTFGGAVTFSTNDANENPFDFTIAGKVATLPGSLDLTFGGGDGLVQIPWGGANSIVVAARRQDPGRRYRWHVLFGRRYNPNGSP